MIALKRVLVATDFGEAAEAALTYGREFARTFGAKLHVVHVVEDVTRSVAGVLESPVTFAQAQADAEDSADELAKHVLSEDDRRTLGAEITVIKQASAAPAIVAFARETGSDMIVMGTHGRGKIARIFIGSVAERVVRTAPCPVLVVHHPEHEFVAPDALQTMAHA
jgi:nucleotide-binding universal stress UspA family protein